MSKNSSAKPYQDNKSVKDIKTFRNKKKEKRKKYVCKQYKNLSEAERLTQYRKKIRKMPSYNSKKHFCFRLKNDLFSA